MRSVRFLTAAVLLGALPAACGGDGAVTTTSTTVAGSEPPAADGAVVVLARDDGWREGLQDATGHPFILAEIVDAADIDEAWAANVDPGLPDGDGPPDSPGIYASLDTVDLDRQAIVIFSSGGSGSCPPWVSDLETVDGRVDVWLSITASPDQACTDDLRPYRLVLAVDRDRLPDAADLPVEEIDVPSDNLTAVTGQIVAYPVA